jgi:hypothetical protein
VLLMRSLGNWPIVMKGGMGRVSLSNQALIGILLIPGRRRGGGGEY